MSTQFETTTLALVEEHVRRLLASMGFMQVTVRCRATSPQVAVEGGNEEVLFRNAALDTPAVGRSARVDDRARLLIDIEAGEEGRLLIGMQGVHLEALQHVVRTLLRPHLETPAYISVDVNGYRLRHEESIMHLAQEAASRAKTTGKVVELKPMGASDRRAVHTALADRRDVTTESRGQDPQRCVVIKPVY